MIIKFNNLNQYETPTITLCNLVSYATVGTSGEVALSDSIGTLFDISDIEIVWNFNALSELNFVVTYNNHSGDLVRDSESKRMYDAVRSRRSVFVEGYGYFIIDNVNPQYSESMYSKNVHAYSVEYEFQTTALPYLPENKGLGIYTNTRTTSDTGILDNILMMMPYWTVGTISSAVLERMRFFENTDFDNCYEFMMQEMQSAFDCIFDFNILTREINVYDKNSFVQETNIHLTPTDFVEKIDIQEDTDSFFTALYVTADDDVNIIPVNPLGTNVIYNFDYYKGDMSSAMLSALNTWETKTANDKIPYSLNEENYQICLLDLINARSDLDVLNTQYNLYSTCYDAVMSESLTVAKLAKYNAELNDIGAAIIGEGGLNPTQEDVRVLTTSAIKTLMNDTKSAIAAKNTVVNQKTGSKITGITSVVAGYFYNSKFFAKRTGSPGSYTYSEEIVWVTGRVCINRVKVGQEAYYRTYKGTGSAWSQITPSTNACLSIREAITDGLSFGHNFTAEQLSELYTYIHEGKYEDSYAVITSTMTYAERMEQYNALYDRAKDVLDRNAEPSYQYSIDVDNFVFVPEMEHFTDELWTGRLVWVELNKNDFAQLFLNAITINYTDASLSFSFGNRYNKYDTKSLYDDALGNIKSTAASVDMLKNITLPVKKNKLSDLEDMILKIRSLAKDEALMSDTEEVVIDSGGYLGRALMESGDFSPEQIKLTHNRLLFTDDAFETVKTVLGKLPMPDGTTKYGINAEVLIGDLIMGGQLVIRNSNNTFVVDSNGIRIDSFADGNGNEVSALNAASSIAYTQDTSKCIRIVNGNIILNAVDSSDAIKISNDCIRLYGDVRSSDPENDSHTWEPNEAAYVAKDSINIANAKIFNQLLFRSNSAADKDADATYSWLIFPRTNGNLSIKWTGISE